MFRSQIQFEEEGHPTIKVFEDRISIKAVDYPQFRDFSYDKIKSLDLFRPYDNSILGLLLWISPTHRNFRKADDFVLRVKLTDGEHWDYRVTHKYSESFKTFIEEIQTKISGLK